MQYLYSRHRSLRLSLVAAFTALALVLVCAVGAFAASVNVYDNAGVLNSGQVRSQASSLPYSIDIYTTKSFTGPKAQFGQEADQKMNRNGMLILAVDTVNKYVWIDGRGVNLTKNDYQNASNSFASDFKSNADYTSATDSAIRSLSSAAGNASSSGSKSSGVTPTPVSGGGFNFGGACCIGLLVLVALGVVFAVMRGRRGGTNGSGGFGNFGGFGGFRRNQQPGYGPNYNQPYNQPGYGPNYPQQGQGMNPWAAGGLGAAAGGLVGYELGKNAGENDNRDNQGFVGGDQGNYDNSGGAGADFGGGNDSGGAGADFGGGGGGDFSGGGGGGGGSDF